MNMTRAEKLAYAEKILAVLRVLNKPAKRIRLEGGGFTDTHELLRKRARVELSVEFGLPGAPWRVYDEDYRTVATAFIATCDKCGAPYVRKSQRQRCCSTACGKRLSVANWARNNKPKVKAYAAKFRQKHPGYHRPAQERWRQSHRSSQDRAKAAAYLRVWRFNNKEKVDEYERRSRARRRAKAHK